MLGVLTAKRAAVAACLPNLAGALAILPIGYAVAKIAALVVRRHILGRLVFWA